MRHCEVFYAPLGKTDAERLAKPEQHLTLFLRHPHCPSELRTHYLVFDFEVFDFLDQVGADNVGEEHKKGAE